MLERDELQAAATLVHGHMSPTPQIHWPLLSQRTGAHVIVKHENHAPTGAFKVRGGITFMDWLSRTEPNTRGIITATRGNHGQSQARAAIAAGFEAHVYVPRGNSVEKNAAMRAYGATLIEHGDDFDEAKDEAMRVAAKGDLMAVPPFHTELVRGVASYGYELLSAHRDLDTIYVAIGCGSGICGVISARNALGLDTKVVGVVSTEAAGAKLSVEAGRLIETNSATTFADGMAVRIPVQAAFDIYSKGAARVISVTDDEVASAMRAYYTDTHNLAEGAGAGPLAGLMQESGAMQGKKVGVILGGGNIDLGWYKTVLMGDTPRP